MPKVFRVMKVDETNPNCPKVGDTACCLGVRDENGDIAVDPDQMTGPGRGGLSVQASLQAIPPYLLPRKYAEHMAEGAAGRKAPGRKSYWVWTMGKGAFANSPFATGLQLNCIELDYGHVEPDSRMLYTRYQQALADTKPGWTIVKPQ